MNFITYDRAYCLYPVETLEKSTALILDASMSIRNELLLKYASYGFQFYVSASQDEFRHKDPRWVEDSHSFVISLSTFRSYSVNVAFVDPIRVTSWSITTTPGENHSMFFKQAVYSASQDNHPVVVFSTQMKKAISDFAASGRLGRWAVYVTVWEDIDIT